MTTWPCCYTTHTSKQRLLRSGTCLSGRSIRQALFGVWGFQKRFVCISSWRLAGWAPALSSAAGNCDASELEGSSFKLDWFDCFHRMNANILPPFALLKTHTTNTCKTVYSSVPCSQLNPSKGHADRHYITEAPCPVLFSHTVLGDQWVKVMFVKQLWHAADSQSNVSHMVSQREITVWGVAAFSAAGYSGSVWLQSTVSIGEYCIWSYTPEARIHTCGLISDLCPKKELTLNVCIRAVCTCFDWEGGDHARSVQVVSRYPEQLFLYWSCIKLKFQLGQCYLLLLFSHISPGCLCCHLRTSPLDHTCKRCGSAWSQFTWWNKHTWFCAEGQWRGDIIDFHTVCMELVLVQY